MRQSSSTSDLSDRSLATEQAILALEKFHAQFPAEKDCVEELYRKLDEAGLLSCRYCGLSDPERNRGDRSFRCRRCHKKNWFTAGTFFNRMRNARYRLAILWLMERGIVLNSSKLHRILGISQSNALSILKKIATVVQGHMDEGTPSVHSSLFAFALCKRSRETPARAHPVAEIEEIEHGMGDKLSAGGACADATRGSTSSGSEVSDIQSTGRQDCALSEATTVLPSHAGGKEQAFASEIAGQQKEAYDMLSETPVHFEALHQRSGIPAGELSAALVMLELAGAVTRLPGDHYVRSAPKPSCKNAGQSHFGADLPSEVFSTVVDFVDFVRAHLHGISRKYLQKYLAAHWYYIDRASWQPGALLEACLRFGPITYNQILDYVSPAQVKMWACQ